MLLWSGADGGRAFMCDPAAHCIDVVDQTARPMFSFGRLGYQPGEFNEPSDVIVLPTDGWLELVTEAPALVAVADRGNHRVQIFELDGVLLAVLKPGRHVRGLAGRTLSSPLFVELDGLIQPSRLAWRAPWLEITTYGQRLVRRQLAHALKAAADGLVDRTTRTAAPHLLPRRSSAAAAAANATGPRPFAPVTIYKGR